jgi:signal peptidase II
MLRSADYLKKGKIILLVSSLVVILDYLTKEIIIAVVMPHEIINILPFLNIVHVRNKGVAFGILSDLGNNLFIFITIVAILLIIYYLSKLSKKTELYSLSMILGGAIGNLIDRIRFGEVVDFIDFFVGKWHWPAFNVADSALTIGIIIFFIASLYNTREA